MLRGTVCPRFPWGVPPDAALKGVPGTPYLAPIPVPAGADGLDPVDLCWAMALLHISALHALYMGAGHSRITERLLQMVGGIGLVFSRRAPYKGGPFVSDGVKAGEAALDEHGPLVSSSEAGWWAVAAQASFALSAWYGLHEATDEEAALAAKLHRTIRAGVVCMYGEAPASKLLDLATGDGAGDLLKLVAEVHVGLEVRP